MAEQALPTNIPQAEIEATTSNIEVTSIADFNPASETLKPTSEVSPKPQTTVETQPQVADDTLAADNQALESLESTMAFQADAQHTSSGEVAEYNKYEKHIEQKFTVK